LTRIKNVRNTTKFKRSIKAISPVIATLLMIAIAVVSSLVVYAWVSGYMGFQTTKAGKEIQLQSFALDNSNKLHVYVQNVGQGIVTINAAYVNDSFQNITPDSNYPDNGLPEGKTADITVAGTYNTNDKLNIKVTTTDGTFMTTIGKVTSSSSGSIVNYNIVVTNPAGSHGTITPAGTTSYAAGSTPSFTITPDVGYHIASVTTNAGAQALTSPYVFPALSADGTLTATFAANTPLTLTLRPNGVGNAAELDHTGTQNYLAVDETVADGTTSYVSRSSSSTGFYTDTYAIEDTSATGTINYVKIYAVCNYDGGTATPHARTVLRVSGTDYYGYDTTAITSTWSTISTTYNTNPAGGNWDWAAINALQSGVDLYRTSNGGTIRCTQVYVEVNYTP